METPLREAPRPEAARPRSVLRICAVAALALLVAAAFWRSTRPAGTGEGPESVFDYVRERALAGDGEALWRVLLPGAREDYVSYLSSLNSGKFEKEAEVYRRATGLSREDLRTLPPERILARETEAGAAGLYKGGRVYDLIPQEDGSVVLRISLGDGSERSWTVRKVDEGWKVVSLWALTGIDGRLLGGR